MKQTLVDYIPTVIDSRQQEAPSAELRPVAKVELDPHLGRVLGGYTVVRRLAGGGMGTVYVGRDERTGDEVAIKVLLPEYTRNQEVVKRFFNEARAAQVIRHPGVIEIHRAEFDDTGAAFIVMELLQGESLADRLKRDGRLACDELTAIATQIIEILGAAHARGIVHRDLKPANIFLVPDASAPDGVHVKLLDFGIAKLQPLARGPMTRTGDVLGTPPYMAPEQCRGARVDHRADLYALGCLLYAMACGRPPFVSPYPGDIICAHLYKPVTAPRTYAPDLPVELDSLIMALLEKTPAKRIQTTDHVLARLNGTAERSDDRDAPVAEKRPSMWKRLLAFGGAGTVTAAAGVLMLALI